MFSSQFGPPPVSFFFLVFFLHLFCFHFTDGTQNACQDLLTGASRIRAMLHNEQTNQFYILTSSGHIFIEPISNFDAASSPPSLKLTKAKYSMPTEWTINDHPETIRADNADLTFRVNPENHTETLLNSISQESDTICVRPGVRLDGESAQVVKVSAICTAKYAETAPDFWLGFNSQSYGMVDASGFYCRIYSFPNGKNDALISSGPWEFSSECLGYTPKEGGVPRCGVVHKEGNIAIVIQDTSTVYVYRKLLSDHHWYSHHSKNQLLTKRYRGRPQPTKHQINEFIKCQETKTEINPRKTETPQPMGDSPMMRKLIIIISGILLLVALIFGLVVKFKLAQDFPWNRKRKPLISQAYSVAISNATTVSREGTLQRILRQRKTKLGKFKKKRGHTRSTTPGTVTKVLDKVKRDLVNSVESAKKHKKKKKKMKKKRKGR